ncbi:Zinc finger C3HC4 type, partial [Trichostrongylus colubriformis]
EEESSVSEEEARDDLERTIMENENDDDIQILDENVEPPNSNPAASPSNSDSELNPTNRPKRRRTDNFATENDKDCQPGVSTETTASTTALGAAGDEETDDGCTICYEEYTSAGEHRLASVKCGHFFGYSCIARWIRSEGRNAVCPTCKTKTTLKDIRKHYTAAVKVTDTTEVEMLRNSNAALHIRVSGLEVELAKKDREIAELIKKLQEGKSAGSAPIAPHLVVQQRGGRMFMNPERKEALANGGANADARAMDFNGEVWAVGVACSKARNIFSPFGIRILTISRQEFKLRECYPLHSGRSRVVVFSPFESSLLLSGGEDKRAVVSMDGVVRRQWRMPNEKPVWTGCWTAPNKVSVTLGLGDGRVLEYAVDSDSTEPLRDYTQGVGHLPIIFTGFDAVSSTLLVASFKKLVAFRNDKVFPLLSNVDGQCSRCYPMSSTK